MEMGLVGGREQREDGGVRWSIGGSPIDYHNCVVAADLDAGRADAAIAQSLERIRAHGVPGSWHVGPSMRPPDLGSRLLAAGFTEGGSEPGMAADLRELPELDPPEGLRIAAVATTQELKVWSDTLARGFGEGEREATWVGSVFGRIGFGTGRWHHYLAYLNGEPVATSTVHRAAGVAGLYFVMTVPEARRRGVLHDRHLRVEVARVIDRLNISSRLGNLPRMPIKFENVGIAVRDLEATIAFFTDLGLTVLGRDTVSGEWTDTAVGLDGNHANIAMLQTPDGSGRLELFEYIHPDAIETEPTRPNEIGMHRVAFSVDDIDEALQIAARHGCHPLRGVATYEDIYKLTYVRGPSGILVMLAEELNKN
jgi:glyoxylase I family protein